ncbi:MAG: amino acid adenylation domain-containing protein [Croceivirga sp.]
MIFSLVDIVSLNSRKFPGKDAFRFLSSALTHSELEEKSNKLAKHLKDKGVKRGFRVGIYMNRCLESAIAVYGILKAGGCYVPLDPAAPIERSRFVLKDCNIKHLVTTKNQSRKIKKLLATTTEVDCLIGCELEDMPWSFSWEDIFKLSLKDYLALQIMEQDLAYILYTSGSTGTPKGIMHTHYSALNYAKLVVDQYQFDTSDVLGSTAPLHFDMSTFGYFAAPLAGATCTLISDMHLKMPTSLVDFLKKSKITAWYSVPLILIQLLQTGLLKNEDFDTLKWVLFAGEVFPTKHLRSLMGIWKGKTFGNVYGPTEVNQCTFYNLRTAPKSDAPIPIGRVWKNTEYKILDENDKEVSEGQPGLLVIRSGTMMKGYWNNPELTKALLYQETIVPGANAVYYRTGDLVQLNTQGELLFLGRKDRQIKIRGFRIEIDEVENTLLRIADVAEVAVVVNQNNDEKVLMATVLPRDNRALDVGEIYLFCKLHLPPYAVPEQIEIWKEFPRTGTGKIDRKAIAHKLTFSKYER